jgi:transposase
MRQQEDEEMRKGLRKSFSAAYKFKVAIEAIRGEKTTAELCQEYGIASSQLFSWKRALLEHGAEIFTKGIPGKLQQESEVEKLHATIGRLKVENDFLSKVLGKSR